MYTTNFNIGNHIIVDDDNSFPHLAGREWWTVCFTATQRGYEGPEHVLWGSLTSCGFSRDQALEEIEKYLEQALTEVRAERHEKR